MIHSSHLNKVEFFYKKDIYEYDLQLIINKHDYNCNIKSI